MKNNRLIALLLAATHIAAFCLMPETAQAAGAGLPITAQSAVLMEGATQRMVYSKNIHLRRQPASTVKLLTSIVVLNHLSLNQVITIPRFATKVEPSKIYLKTGEHYYVKDLVRALLISSANDAAEVLAVAVAGSTQNFAALMNQKAKSLGSRHSNFVRANGLPARNQYSTAYDMTLIMAEADRYPFIVQTLKTKITTIQSLSGRRIGLRNHNRMLWKDHREVLGKTGWTRAAKYCFVGLINAYNRQVFVTMLGSRKLWKDLKRLVDYQFGSAVSKVRTNDKLWATAGTKRIQLCLQRAGFHPGPADGQFGPRTIKAIEGFQSANGLHVDGIVGQDTWARLKRFA